MCIRDRVSKLGLGELAGGLLDDAGVGPARHRQHDVEGLAPMALLADVGAAVLPLPLDALERLLAALDDVAVVLDVETTVLGDVAKVRPDRRHAPPSPRHLDHDLGGTAHGGLDAVADRRRAEPDGTKARRPALDDPIARVE